jgi:hypothetical protein
MNRYQNPSLALRLFSALSLSAVIAFVPCSLSAQATQSAPKQTATTDQDDKEEVVKLTDKSLLQGDFLVDDRASGKGQERFQGELVQFGSEKFYDWPITLNYLVGRL